MITMRKTFTMSLLAAGSTALALVATPASAAGVGVYGVDVGNGDVTNSPGHALSGGAVGSYDYVTTAGSTATPTPPAGYPAAPYVPPSGQPPYINGGFTNGSTNTFMLNVTTGEKLYFNFVTTDGTNTLNPPYPPLGTAFEDYAWASINGSVIYQAQSTITPAPGQAAGRSGASWAQAPLPDRERRRAAAGV